ncbi:MAG: hypothetical protein GIW97_07590 [Candidatus Eremiobacteraeota bacterium]|nr:hypothetical protein [Candidatus Eremiobacteraeota bacterium]
MPTCKGRVVVVNVKTHMYYPTTKMHATSKSMMMMCEAAAKGKGYHMMSHTAMTKMHSGMTKMHSGMMTTHMKPKAMTPAVNPSGAMNADKGASPNPDNNQNGVHTTAAPNPSPTP